MNVTLAEGYRPFDKQVAFHKSPARFKVATSGNRAGKTISGGAEFVWNVYRDLHAGRGKQPVRIGSSRIPRLHYWVITPTKELGEYPYREIVRYTPRELIESINASTNEIWLRGHIQIEFKSTERAERLVAASLNGVWMDEAPRCKAEAWRGGLRARLADQLGWALFTGSPFGGKNSWLYQDVVSLSGQDDYEAFEWTTADNPYIPRSEIEQARRTLPAAWFKRDWEASWDSFGGAIYEEFSDDLHITTEEKLRFEYGIPRDRPLCQAFNRIIGAIDFGFVAPGCLLIVGEMGEGNWVVLDEVYAAGMRPVNGTTKTWLGAIRDMQVKWGVREFVGDPEDAGAMFDLRNNQVSIRAANKNVYMGIRRVAAALHPRGDLGRPGLRVMAHCKNLVREIRNYQWKPNKDQSGFFEEPADGQSDHAADALRYAAMELRLYDYVEQQRTNPSARPLG